MVVVDLVLMAVPVLAPEHVQVVVKGIAIMEARVAVGKTQTCLEQHRI